VTEYFVCGIILFSADWKYIIIIIRILDVLIPKLTPSDSVCSTSSADVFESMRGLSALDDELSLNDDIYFSTQKRQSLKSSVLIVSQVTDFLYKESHFKFDHFCTKERELNTEFITAIGKIMGDLADLYTVMGGFTAAMKSGSKKTSQGKLW
jgi:hypothetical protein